MTYLICPDFPPELLARIKAEAKRMNVTMSFLVRMLVERAFAELDKETAPGPGKQETIFGGER